METVNMHEAKTHLSRLVEKAAKGEPVIIARAGKLLLKVTAIDRVDGKPKSRFGFLKGQITAEQIAGFKSSFKDEIEEMFYGEHE